PGFEAFHGPVRLKVKFKETTSEPLTARLFAALGYHVEPADHAAALRLRYDRRFLREFHLRKEVRTEIEVLWLVPVYTIELQKRYDPFEFITAAVLRDGRHLSGAGF